MTAKVTDQDLSDYLALATDADVEAATDFALDLLERGVDSDTLISTLLVPAQLEVGRRWETNEWNVAQEHAATAVTDAVLAAVASSIASVRSGEGHLVVACAEGEYHTMPTRMATELLRSAGWKVTFIGPSTPAAHLRDFVASVNPSGVAVACSVPIFLAGARRTIDAVREVGVPAYAAGRGFGTDDYRARRLGADGWFASTTELVQWPRTDEAPPVPPEHLALEAARPDVVRRAFKELCARMPAVSQYNDDQLDRTREDFDYTLQFLSAAVLVEDDRLFDDYVDWALGLLEARNVPRPVLATSLECLLAALPRELDTARSLLNGAIKRLS